MEALEQHGPAVVALRAALEPTVTDVPGLLVAGRLEPAQGVLAGDWYDLTRVDEHCLALVLGDVAGHGPASAEGTRAQDDRTFVCCHRTRAGASEPATSVS